ncbi:STAS/SEC14 domain-containing protein [Marinobacter sp. S6332]|uniref:STAS/SEC14 domain-containing protein n=1 Tax=Marinobacter sp. S6332 TaxID=2926403 RepID=UPI001FF54C6E|nr:STAS/SEC14 domain-containing protein [Marinobacter sp. S6332]MCK0163124.1 STAS/SEC14 domain-containing protein [Marinobacter sp. S6332]
MLLPEKFSANTDSHQTIHLAQTINAPPMPYTEAYTFNLAQGEDGAMLKHVSAPDHGTPPNTSIRFIQTNKDNVLAFEIDGVMSSEEMPGVIRKMEDFLAGQNKVRLLNRIKHFGGFDPAIFNPLFPDIDMRTFTVAMEEDAWAWLEAEPAEVYTLINNKAPPGLLQAGLRY